MWPVCVRCVSSPACPCYSQPWWGQWILQFLHISPFILVVNTEIPVASSWFSASTMLCAVTTGQQPVESPSPKFLKVLFSLNIFLHCELQYSHCMRKQILLCGRGREETGQPTGVSLLFRACRFQMCSLTEKVLSAAGCKTLESPVRTLSSAHSIFPIPVGSLTPKVHWEAAWKGHGGFLS